MTHLDPDLLVYLYTNGTRHYDSVIVPIRDALQRRFDGIVVGAHISEVTLAVGGPGGGVRIQLRGEDLNPGHVFARTFLSPFGTLLAETLESQGARVRNRPAAVRTADSKTRTALALAAAGVPVPEQVAVAALADGSLCGGEDTRWPRVIKRDFGFGGAGVSLAPDRESMRFALEQDLPGALYVSQEFIAETAGSDVRILVADGRVVASVQRRSTRGDFRANTSLGGTMAAVDINEAEADIAVRAANAVGLTYAGVDLLRSDHGPLISEVNANPDLRPMIPLFGVTVLDQVAAAIVGH